MEWMPEALGGLLDGHGKQLLIAAELAVLGTLFMVLVYRLKLRRDGRRGDSEIPPKPAMPQAEVKALYEQESELSPESFAMDALEDPPTDNESCPPELSRRIDKLEERVRGLALRARG